MKLQRFTMIEMMVVIAVILLLIALISPALARLRRNANKAEMSANVRDIIIAMKAYADRSRSKKMPYPLAASAGDVPWGDPTLSSVKIAELLLEQAVIKPEELAIFLASDVGANYVPLKLGPDQKKIDLSQKERWDEGQELNYQMFTSKFLKSTGGGTTIVCASYDNEELLLNHFEGEGWIIGTLDGRAEYRTRAMYPQYDTQGGNPKLADVAAQIATDATAIDSTAKDFKTRVPSATGLGGGSTELMGLTSKSAYFKVMVTE